MRHIARDLDRAVAAIRFLGLTGPHDPVGEFTLPKDPGARDDLADAVFDLTDQHAARAIRDAPRMTITTRQRSNA